jgi:hypothetical protein
MRELIENWLAAKEAEKQAVEARREIEDELVTEFLIPENLDGTENKTLLGYQVKIVGRMNRTIDAELLQELAAENGLSEHLNSLFRWKPDINMALWNATNESITKPLLGAITTKAGRPSFSITKIED